MSHVVVIGAGLAGLSAACHLVGDGHRVTVLEREDVPGGRAGRLTRDGFTFDTGPTVLTMPELIDRPLRRRLQPGGAPRTDRARPGLPRLLRRRLHARRPARARGDARGDPARVR